MKINPIELKTLIFFLLMTVITLLTFTTFSKYLNLIIISFVIVQIFYPIYSLIKRKLKSTSVATALSVILVLLILIVPITVILILVVSEIQNLANSTSLFVNVTNLENIVNNIINGVNSAFSQREISLNISNINLSESFAQLDKTALFRDQLLPLVGGIASLSGEILFTLFLILLSLIYLFPAYDKLPAAISRISPLDNDVDNLFITRFKDTIRGVVKGTLVVAILQATAVIIPFIMLQVGAPVLLWIIMVILSVVPVGSGLVWAPVGLAIILNGISQGSIVTVILGIALIIYSGIIINVIDTTIRPRLMKDAVNLHPLITIFSVLGGIGLFGFLGILYGPLIVVLFLTVMEVYRTKYLEKDE